MAVHERQNKVIAIASLGGFLEAYDFTVYAHMAAYLSVVFFPDVNVGTSLLNTFITFSVGYLARPLGAIVFSHWGDRYGRKGSFTVTVIVMAVATFGIGVLPGFEKVGMLAPLLLAVLRLLQGFSFAGEFAGGVTYLFEIVPSCRQGKSVAWLGAGTMAGVLMGVVMHNGLLFFLSEQTMVEWGVEASIFAGGSFRVYQLLYAPTVC